VIVCACVPRVRVFPDVCVPRIAMYVRDCRCICCDLLAVVYLLLCGRVCSCDCVWVDVCCVRVVWLSYACVYIVVHVMRVYSLTCVRVCVCVCVGVICAYVMLRV